MSFLQKTLDFEEALYLNKIPICRSPCCHRVGRALWTGEGRVSDDLLSQAIEASSHQGHLRLLSDNRTKNHPSGKARLENQAPIPIRPGSRFTKRCIVAWL
ncbi:hypothetical protein RRG08_014220 [Elysia crispata]|uniref:Uncharacterized protein n=1 Tax=Elysia crispata TaxID=231223 RepID=A0AAE0XEF7_9GAST|nr:hypothetical protein RRG08_014220 [Elysia crispata]